MGAIQGAEQNGTSFRVAPIANRLPILIFRGEI
jgi:hypothetical protein